MFQTSSDKSLSALTLFEVIGYVIFGLRSNIGGFELFPLFGLTYFQQKTLKCWFTEKKLLCLFTVKGVNIDKIEVVHAWDSRCNLSLPKV